MSTDAAVDGRYSVVVAILVYHLAVAYDVMIICFQSSIRKELLCASVDRRAIGSAVD